MTNMSRDMQLLFIPLGLFVQSIVGLKNLLVKDFFKSYITYKIKCFNIFAAKAVNKQCHL